MIDKLKNIFHRDRYWDKYYFGITQTKYSVEIQGCFECSSDSLIGIFNSEKQLGYICPVCHNIYKLEEIKMNDFKIVFPNADGTKTEIPLNIEDSVELHPCPKCNSPVVITVRPNHPQGYFCVRCDNCDFIAPTVSQDEKIIISSWNKACEMYKGEKL